MQLSFVELGGFQSYGSAQRVDVEPDVTLLAGRNNVGKSALMRALQVFREPQEGARDDFQLRYGFTVSCDELEALVRQAGVETPAVGAWIRGGGVQQPLEATFISTEGNGTIRPKALWLERLALPALETEYAASPGRKGGWSSGPLANGSVVSGEMTDLVRRAVSRVVYIGPRRVDQGLKTLTPASVLTSDARNLTEVLTHLQRNERYGAFEAVEQVMRDAFPDVRGLTVSDRGAGNSTQLMGEPQVYFDHRPDPVPLRQCGTGLEMVLALAVALLAAEEQQLVLVDEPQAYLHPQAERAMLSLLEAHPHHQYIVASHSHVLLRSWPLTKSRLLTLQNAQTAVTQIRDEQAALIELGVTAADLWLAERLLWVEGPSEKRVYDLLAEHDLPPAARAALAIREMPEASKYGAKNKREAEFAYRFTTEIVRSVAPLSIDMRFVFDRDEKSPDFRETMNQAAGGRARFLAVRELENVLLEPRVLHAGLREVCELSGLPDPAPADVARRLDELLASDDDPDLFPAGRGSEPARDTVRASRLLDRLWWEFATSHYDKVREGERLARHAIALAPDILQPLRDILAEFGSPAAAHAVEASD
jgi:predicted ATPase